MQRLLGAFAAVLVFTTPSLAIACRVGGIEVLFEAPPADAPSFAQSITGRFTTHGADFDRWLQTLPYVDEASLIGIVEYEPGRWAPVYHPLNSCLHGFYGRPRLEMDRHAWLAGRFERVGPHTVFKAAGNWNGRWVYIDPEAAAVSD